VDRRPGHGRGDRREGVVRVEIQALGDRGGQIPLRRRAAREQAGCK
jgi:hypothetical protein